MGKMKSKAGPAPLPPEPHFKEAVNVYFQFHKQNFRDEDGFGIAPNWEGLKRGMESRAMKLLLATLRGIAEGKKKEWSLEYMQERLNDFLSRAYRKQFYRKNFMLVMLNKYKFDILSSSYNPNLVKKILETWYFEMPEYAVDRDKDQAAAEIIVGFLKQQYVLASLNFEEASVLASVKLIFKTVKADEWWRQKSLKSIANNIQEFVNRIKSARNGSPQYAGVVSTTPTSDSKIRALKEWGLKPDKNNEG